MNYLVRATPHQRLHDLTADERGEVMARERAVAAALIDSGAIVWMWRLPGSVASVSIWSAESEEALGAHLATLPLSAHHDVEIIALAGHPAFPAALHAGSPEPAPAGAAAPSQG